MRRTGSTNDAGRDAALDVLGDLIDTLHDELAYECSQSSYVLEQVRRACRLLDGPYAPYLRSYPWQATDG